MALRSALELVTILDAICFQAY